MANLNTHSRKDLNDPVFIDKVSAASKASTAHRQAERMDRTLLAYIVAMFGFIAVAFFFHSLAWYALIPIVVLAVLFKVRNDKVVDLRGKAVNYRSLSPKRNFR